MRIRVRTQWENQCIYVKDAYQGIEKVRTLKNL